MMDGRRLQVLRTIDKFDKIGRDGVVALLQKPLEEFGADLDPIQAGLVGMFLVTTDKAGDNDKTIANLSAWFKHAAKVKGRVHLMALMEETAFPDGTTAWDKFLSMPSNADETWDNGGRPANIAWALDDIVLAFEAKGGNDE